MLRSIEQLNQLFRYKPDERDTWRVLTEQDCQGDCDDYSLTALYILSGTSWLKLLWNVLTMQKLMWYVRTENGNPHMALWVRGRGWICNIYPTFGPLKHKRLFPVLLPSLLLGLLVKR
jgi:predicted transglutaminase-like cysteine proteinase